VLALAALGGVPSVEAGDRTDIPLKNWGGFAVFRDAVYDDLERLVTAGLADRTLLSTKPMSRIEAARIVARAIAKIRSDEMGTYNNRQDLESLLDRLILEFRTELAQLGVSIPDGTKAPTGPVSFTPVDRAQVWTAYSSHNFSLINSQGMRLQQGINGGVGFESRAQIGDWVTFYLHPEMHGNEDFGQARLQTGYVKFTLMNVELVVGRENLWWGPGLHGSLIMSNNAPPLDQIRLGAAEPFKLPWIGEYIGPMKVLGFAAQMEERRDHPRAILAGLRGTVSPFSVLEIGASYVNMFGGTDPPTLNGFSDYINVLFNPQASDQKNPANQKFRNNALFAIDADLRLPNVMRWGLPAKDLRLYGEFGWDDTCCGTSFVPLKDAASFLGGLQLMNVFGMEGVDYRIEYANSSRFSFTHNQFFRGYWTRGEVISHAMGTDGSDLFTRLSARLGQDLMVGFGMNRIVIGNTTFGAATPPEKRTGAMLDVSYRFLKDYTLFTQAQFMRVNDRNFVAGNDSWDGILLVELTRSFR
jgi:hypothetical protein